MIKKLLFDIYARFYLTRKNVHIAKSEKERKGVYQLRYEVYAQEHHAKSLLDAYSTHEIETPEDLLDHAIIFYIGPKERPHATGRAMLYQAGMIPDEVYKKYSLDLFPDIHQRVVFEVNFFTARKDYRGGAAIISLLAGAARVMVEEHHAEVLIGDCVPALLNPYRRLGLRTYGGKLISFEGGLLVPVVGILADLKSFRRVGSPMYWVLNRLAKKGLLSSKNMNSLLLPVEEATTDGDLTQFIQELKRCKASHKSVFLNRINDSIIKDLASSGLIFNLSPGQELVREGFSDQEMFLILHGHFEIIQGEKRLRGLTEGDFFGEMSFFSGTNQRTATVRSLLDGRVLLIRRRFIERLKNSRPQDAFTFYEALVAVLTERFSL